MYKICDIDKKIYGCITNNIVTSEVVLTEKQIQHIREHHPEDYQYVISNLQYALTDPDYIIQDKQFSNTGLVIKKFLDGNSYSQVVLRICTSEDEEGYKNSIISSWKISERRLQNYLRNRRILYKRV